MSWLAIGLTWRPGCGELASHRLERSHLAASALCGRLLTLVVQQDRAAGLRAIAFVAAERSLQRRVARQALVETCWRICGHHPSRNSPACRADLNWTTDAPLDLPSPLPEILPRVYRSDATCRAVLESPEPLSSSADLERAAEEVQRCSEACPAAGNASRRGFCRKSMAGNRSWMPPTASLAQTHRRASDSQSVPVRQSGIQPRYKRLHGPPRRGSPDRGQHPGRCQAPTLLLYGPRRMGKTSILNQLPRLLGPDFAAAVIDCQNPAVTGGPAAGLAYWSRSLSQAMQERGLHVPPLDRKSLGGDAFAEFDEWLDRTLATLPAALRVLVCWDEYERLQQTLDAGWGGQLLDYLRHLLQHRPQIVPLFTGVRTFRRAGPGVDRPVRQLAANPRGTADPRGSPPLLTKPIPEFDLTYAAGALDRLLDATAGQPFLTQATAYELVNWLNRQDRRKPRSRTSVRRSIWR